MGVTATKFAETTPTPWSIETVVAFATDQRSVVDWPAATLAASGAKEAITGAGPPPPPEVLEQAAIHATAQQDSGRLRIRIMAALQT